MLTVKPFADGARAGFELLGDDGAVLRQTHNPYAPDGGFPPMTETEAAEVAARLTGALADTPAITLPETPTLDARVAALESWRAGLGF